MFPTLHEIVPVLQSAIGPVILISGIGLLLLSLTNRFARILDRARTLARDLRESPLQRQPGLQELALMLRRRALWNRWSIGFASTSIFFVSLLIVLLFVQALLRIDNALPVICVFCLCLVCLVASVVTFIWDIHLSVLTMSMELDDVATEPKEPE